MALPEVVVGARFADQTAEGHRRAGSNADFWDVQLAYASGALLANLIAAPVAGVAGFFLIFASADNGLGILYAALVAAVLLIGVLYKTTKLGHEHPPKQMGGAFAGFLAGLVLLALILGTIAGEIALALLFFGAAFGVLPFVAGGAVLFTWIVRIGLQRRRAALALPPREVAPAAPPPL